MRIRILVLFFPVMIVSHSSSAQEKVAWTDYLKDLKNYFYLKDTIVLGFKTVSNLESPKSFIHARSDDYKHLFNSKFIDESSGSEIYFYSYYVSEDYFSILTYYTFGRYT